MPPTRRSEKTFDIPGWDALIHDLQDIAGDLVAEYRQRYLGVAMTWRTLLELEQRALGRLRSTDHHSPDLLHLIRSDTGTCFPPTDEPVDLGRGNVMTIVMGEIWRAYKQVH